MYVLGYLARRDGEWSVAEHSLEKVVRSCSVASNGSNTDFQTGGDIVTTCA